MIAGPSPGCDRCRRCRSGRTGTRSAGPAACSRRCELDADERQLGDAGRARRGAAPASGGARRSTSSRGSGLTANGWPTAPTAAACRRRCRCRPSSRRGRRRGRPPRPAPPAACPCDHTNGPVEPAGVAPVGVDRPAGGDDVVEPEPLGQRPHPVLGRRGRHHHRAAGGAVLGEQPGRVRLDQADQAVGGLGGRRRTADCDLPLASATPPRASAIDGSVSPNG